MKIKEITENLDPKSIKYQNIILSLFEKASGSLSIVEDKLKLLTALNDKKTE